MTIIGMIIGHMRFTSFKPTELCKYRDIKLRNQYFRINLKRLAPSNRNVLIIYLNTVAEFYIVLH